MHDQVSSLQVLNSETTGSCEALGLLVGGGGWLQLLLAEDLFLPRKAEREMRGNG